MKLKSIYIFIAALVLAYSNLQAQPPQYNVTLLADLGLGPNTLVGGINNLGDIVGTIRINPPAGSSNAFLYSKGQVTYLGSLGGNFSSASDTNDSRQIVGQSETAQGNLHAFLYENNTMTDLGTIAGDSGTSSATAINNKGIIVGSSGLTDGISYVNYAVAFWEGSIVTLNSLYSGNSSFANNVNDNYTSSKFGEIVGVTATPLPHEEVSAGQQAFLYSNEDMQNIDYACPNGYNWASFATSINNAGQIVGECFSSVGEPIAFFVYDNVNRKSKTIGSESVAFDINDNGEIIGSETYYEAPFLYMNSTVYNLYSLIPSNSGLTGLIPIAINNQGQIAANSDQGVVLLTPVTQNE